MKKISIIIILFLCTGLYNTYTAPHLAENIKFSRNQFIDLQAQEVNRDETNPITTQREELQRRNRERADQETHDYTCLHLCCIFSTGLIGSGIIGVCIDPYYMKLYKQD